MSEPIKIELGTELVCEGHEFIVVNYQWFKDRGGKTITIQGMDPILALTRQMEQEKARENQAKALGLMEKLEKELGEGEKWKE